MSWLSLALVAGLFTAAVYVAYRVTDLRARLALERWKAEHARAIGREAIKGNQSAVAGRVLEKVAPFLPGFGFNPRDARFLGDPVDFVVFDGLSEGSLREVVFVEVKSGTADLNGNERKVRDAIEQRRIKWSVYRVPEGAVPASPVTPAAIVALSAATRTLGGRGRF
jgi:predicted Holliday junction resolvase-like endonuclease